MSQPVHISVVIREVMQMLERKRELENRSASRPQGQGGSLPLPPAGNSAEAGGLRNGKPTN